MKMDLGKIVKETCARMNITNAELSRRVEQSPQNLGRKLNNGTLSYDDFTKIMEALNTRFDYRVIIPGEELDAITDDRTREKINILEDEIRVERRNLDYLYKINHDIRSGINVITGSLDLINKHPNDTKKVTDCIKNINIANNEIKRLLDDVNDLKIIFNDEEVDEKSLEGKKCLLAEDNELNRDITKEVLEDFGVEVLEVNNGKDALSAFRKHGDFDFVLMDLEMPILNGYKATEQIRKLNKDIPVYAYSANTTKEQIKQAKESGVTAFISKPVDAKKLLAVLAKNNK